MHTYSYKPIANEENGNIIAIHNPSTAETDRIWAFIDTYDIHRYSNVMQILYYQNDWIKQFLWNTENWTNIQETCTMIILTSKADKKYTEEHWITKEFW